MRQKENGDERTNRKKTRVRLGRNRKETRARLWRNRKENRARLWRNRKETRARLWRNRKETRARLGRNRKETRARLWRNRKETRARLGTKGAISYPESSGSLVSGLVARRDSGGMEFFPQKSGVPVVVRMLSFIKTEVNVSLGKLVC